MSILRFASPGNLTRLVDLGPSVATTRRGRYATLQAAPVGEMTPVVKHGTYLENRHRVKPQNPLSLHRENRR